MVVHGWQMLYEIVMVVHGWQMLYEIVMVAHGWQMLRVATQPAVDRSSNPRFRQLVSQLA